MEYHFDNKNILDDILVLYFNATFIIFCIALHSLGLPVLSGFLSC